MSKEREDNHNGDMSMKTILLVLSITTSLIVIAGTFLTIGEFKGQVIEKLDNAQRVNTELTIELKKITDDLRSEDRSLEMRLAADEANIKVHDNELRNTKTHLAERKVP
jgi:hypothetical protein